MIEMTKEELTQATKGYGKKHIAHRMANVLLALSEQKPSAFVMKDDLADPAIVSTPAYLDIEDAEQKTIGDRYCRALCRSLSCHRRHYCSCGRYFKHSRAS
ncbi:hypothetical protein ACT4EB_003062 [Escherichia coli]|nr:hypothetical protein [Escherichia coli]EFC9899793.1 hypothetical protein [Escherichia coli]EFL0390584.1 hypothetical protein [Escherichia coli]EFL2167795.1 hypothetical protein [Escherichia coli]EFL6010884.1 hypothetical protein [Escherichia coli]